MNNQSEQSYGDLKTQLNFINFPEGGGDVIRHG